VTYDAFAVGAFGLLGSGEFEPWAEEVDRWLLERARPGPVLILPTASAPEGDDVFDKWGRRGLHHYRRVGVDAEVVPLKTRSDAGRPELVARIGEAAMVFFSGGNPAYLARTLSGTPFWSAVVGGLGAGLAYGGCSAGVAALGERTTDTGSRAVSHAVLRPGLRLFRGTSFAPHWDAVERYRPGLRAFLVEAVGDHRLVAVDERTALVGDGTRWTVRGHGAVHVLERGAWTEHAAGEEMAFTG
jgi:cyanophycinase